MLNSYEIPQADVLSDVIETVRYVNNNKGASDIKIASYLGKVPRQGRYYRHAAELLGFIKNFNNSAYICEDGVQLLCLNGKKQLDFLRERILKLEVFEMALGLVNDKNDCTKEDLEKMLADNGIAVSTSDRRTVTIINWLEDCELITVANGLLIPKN